MLFVYFLYNRALYWGFSSTNLIQVSGLALRNNSLYQFTHQIYGYSQISNNVPIILIAWFVIATFVLLHYLIINLYQQRNELLINKRLKFLDIKKQK